MSKDQFKTGDSPFIRIESCSGDLVVRGWAEPALQIKGTYKMDDSEKGYVITSDDSLHLYVPRDATVSGGRIGGSLVVRQFTGTGMYDYVHGDADLRQSGDHTFEIVHGDLVVRNLIGGVTANEVNGDISIRGAGGLTFGEVHGDLSARVLDGDVVVEMLNGDADLRTVNGSVTINKGYRDVNLNGISGQVAISDVTGDVRLQGGLSEGNHAIEARGDIVVRWPARLALQLTAAGTQIDNRLNFDEVTEKVGQMSGQIGVGNTHLSLVTAGRVILREQESASEHTKYGDDMEFDWSAEMASISSRIEAEVNAHLSRVSRELEMKFGPGFSQGFNEKVARKVEKATEQMRRYGARGRNGKASFDFTPPSPPARNPTSIEEQMKILKMVETGKITPEEAGMLLEALDA